MPCNNFGITELPFPDRKTEVREGYVREPNCDKAGALGKKGLCVRLGVLSGQQAVLFCSNLSSRIKEQIEKIIGATEQETLKLLGVEEGE